MLRDIVRRGEHAGRARRRLPEDLVLEELSVAWADGEEVRPGGGGGERELVWGTADYRAVDGVVRHHVVDETAAHERVDEGKARGAPCEGPGMGGERVEVQVVDCIAKGIGDETAGKEDSELENFHHCI